MKKKILIVTAIIGACAAAAGFLYARNRDHLESLKDLDEYDFLDAGEDDAE